MENDDGFVGAILANPEDETLRLVYADWLDERGDPRGEFLRLSADWAESWGAGEPPDSLTHRVEELRREVDSGWVAVMTTLGLKSEPLKLWRDDYNPVSDTLAIRCTRGRFGQRGGLVTFASQFRLAELPSAGLIDDLQLLAGLGFDLGECYYGSTDFPIYTFIAELGGRKGEPVAREILAALEVRNFRGPGSGEFYEDRITTDYDQQPFFSTEEAGTGAHGALAQYVAPAPVWFVRLRTRNPQHPRDSVQFAVGASSRGDRLVGLVAGGWWS